FSAACSQLQRTKNRPRKPCFRYNSRGPDPSSRMARSKEDYARGDGEYGFILDFDIQHSRGSLCRGAGESRGVKNRKGHKTDRKHSERLADLLRHNHLRASYIPPKAVRELRDLTRRRLQLTQDATRKRNRVEKLWEHVNVKIGNVLCDVFGASGQSMLL